MALPPPDADDYLLIPGRRGDDLVRSVIAILFASCLIGFVLAPLLAPDEPHRMAALVVFALTAGVSWSLMRQGRQRQAVAVLTWGCWFAVVAACIIVDGLRTPGLMALPAVVVLGGAVLGARHALWITLLSGLAVVVLVVLEHHGRYGDPVQRETVFRAAVAMLVLLFSTGVMRYLMLGHRERQGEIRQLTVSLSEQLARIEQRDADLGESMALYQALIDAQAQAGVGLEIIQGGRVTYVNDALCRILGYTREEMLALNNYADIVHPDDRERVAANHQRRLRGETFENRYEIRVQTRRGEARDVEITVAPIVLKGGIGVMVIIVDISDRHRAQTELAQSREMFSHAFADSPVAISFSRLADGRYVDCNPAFLRIFGWARADVIGHTAVDIGIWPNAVKRSEWVARLRDGGQVSDDPIELLHRDGRPLSILAASRLFRIGGETLAMNFLHDVTDLRQAERDLRSSEERFSRVFQAIPVPTLLTRLHDGACIDVNGAFCRQLGWTREEVIGNTSLDDRIWLSAEDRQRWVQRIVADHRMRDYPLTVSNRAGEPRHTLVSAEQVDFGGEPCIVSLIHDFTDREESMRRLMASEEKFSLIFHASPIAISLTRLEDGLCIDVNRAYLDQFGWTREEMVGHSMTEIGMWPPPAADSRERWRQALLAAGGHLRDYDGVLLTKAGEPRHVLGSAEILTLAGAAHVLAYIYDDTERRQAEQAVRELNASLEARVRERTAQLSDANRELESFAYSISHDLRAPLRGIDGFSRLLQEEYGERLDDTGQNYLFRVRRATQRMGGLIDDLLELSRVTRKDMDMREVDLSAMAREILAGLAESEPERRVDMPVGSGCRTTGDAQLLRVLLENLLGNAWKYTARREDARIEFGRENVGVGAGDAAAHTFFVRDNGAGFDMTYADKLFTPFQRLHAPSEFEGSGVGLASCARIVRRHGGRIWGEGSPDRGATFRFTLPSTVDRGE